MDDERISLSPSHFHSINNLELAKAVEILRLFFSLANQTFVFWPYVYILLERRTKVDILKVVLSSAENVCVLQQEITISSSSSIPSSSHPGRTGVMCCKYSIFFVVAPSYLSGNDNCRYRERPDVEQ